MALRLHTANSPAEEAKALVVAKKIERKAVDLLAPLELEMRLMGWRPEFSMIMWHAIVTRATALLMEAERRHRPTARRHA